ncbi:MAG: DUF1294 domain-containing protein [Firmicutes bacterium]|nr:DUF1294 domain-containing protein [[Eubacterium] siraeum]MCM1488384.1 DUF1294 domain-containing protein [Bacillota bacterium]
MQEKWIIQLSYLAAVGIVGLILVIYDKIAAKKLKRHRTPEAVLMLVGIIGGALPMYITMQIIRHKTKTHKFSIGFPLIILLQAALITVLNAWVIK